jgi:hypothetical protein
MTYNVSTWKMKSMENLVIPLAALYESSRKDWHPKEPKIKDAITMEVSLQCGCEQVIVGILKEGNLHVTKLSMSGEGSGGFIGTILRPALEKSSGSFSALAIWEGGDSITSITFLDGSYKEEQVEL